MSDPGRNMIVATLIAGIAIWASAAAADTREQAPVMHASAIDLSSQMRAERPRIRITPLPGPLRRECVAVFEERWIPQWGGFVLYPGQRCWWTRAPA